MTTRYSTSELYYGSPHRPIEGNVLSPFIDLIKGILHLIRLIPFKPLINLIPVKKLTKHLTFINVTVGLITLIVMGIVKWLGIPLIILWFLEVPNSEYSQYFVVGLIGIFLRLGLKGLIEETSLHFSEYFHPLYMTIGSDSYKQGLPSKTEGLSDNLFQNSSDSESDSENSDNTIVPKHKNQEISESSTGQLSKPDNRQLPHAENIALDKGKSTQVSNANEDLELPNTDAKLPSSNLNSMPESLGRKVTYEPSKTDRAGYEKFRLEREARYKKFAMDAMKAELDNIEDERSRQLAASMLTEDETKRRELDSSIDELGKASGNLHIDYAKESLRDPKAINSNTSGSGSASVNKRSSEFEDNISSKKKS